MNTKKIILSVCLIVVSGIFFVVSFDFGKSNFQVSNDTSIQTTLAPFVMTISTTTPTQLATSTIGKKVVTITTAPVKIIAIKTPINTPALAAPASDFTTINTTARTAVVNILCTTQIHNTVSTITGSGVVIDPHGIILTNAHVGQYWLLQNLQSPNSESCIIRTGSPAENRYHAELLYISPAWVKSNLGTLTENNPMGTGQYDFALLRITDATDGSSLSALPYLPANVSENIPVGEPVELASYPAGFLGGQSILQDLYLTSALTTVQNIFTFFANTPDIMSVGGTVVSQKGASGGAVVDGNSTLIGIISTETEATTTAERDLRAITLPYINRTLQTETGFTLSQFLSQDLVMFAHNFQTNVVPGLSKLIESGLMQ